MKKDWLIRFCQEVRVRGGRALLVGGSVRDLLLKMEKETKDCDLEVYGVPGDELRLLLKRLGRVDTVGAHFAVYKFRPFSHPDIEMDISLPRRESKTGVGHRGFSIQGDPHMSFAEATRRRDFTINAMMLDPLTDEILDPQGGQNDLHARRLRAVDPLTFGDDSLRVLRAAQFAARFELEIDPATVDLCRTIRLDDLPVERIWGEVEKILLKARRPSIGLTALSQLGVIDQLFPELGALRGCLQEHRWHPEGDVWVHTLLCVDEAAQLIGDLPREKQITVMLGALAHDFGKPVTSQVIDGRIRSFGHDEAGVPLAQSFMDRLGIHTINHFPVREQVCELVREHLRPGQFCQSNPPVSDGAFRRLVRKVDPDLLYRVAKSDSLGRVPPARSSHMQDWFIARIRELDLEKGPPKPLLMGRHVLPLGIASGPQVGEITRAVYDLQLEGKITTFEEAVEAAQKMIASLPPPPQALSSTGD